MPQNDKGKYMCWRKRHKCAKCRHFYPKEEYDLSNCPECGEPRQCRNPVSYDGEACKYHGGASLKGALSPQYRHGAASKYLPTNLAAKYYDFLSDPDRLALDSEMALIRAMLWDRVKELEKINTAEEWAKAGVLFESFMTAQSMHQKEKAARHLMDLGEVLKKGAGGESLRKEILKMTEQERKLADTQRQLYVDMGEFITRGMALTMLTRFMEAVKSNVLNLEGGPQALSSIAGAIATMAGQLGGSRLERRGTERATPPARGVANG